MLQAPEGRYRIIERDNRLVTIDTQTGKELGALAVPPARGVQHGTQDAPLPPMSSPSASAPAASPPPATATRASPAARKPSKRDAQGRMTITTQRWFDPAGPRRLRLTAQNSKKLEVLQQAAFGMLAFTLFLALLISLPFALFLGGISFFAGRKALPAVLKTMLAGAEEAG